MEGEQKKQKNKKVLTRDVRRLGRDVRFYKTHPTKKMMSSYNL